MDNQDNADKLTEARSSRDSETSGFKKFYINICSCMPCIFQIGKQEKNLQSNTPYQRQQLQAASELRDSRDIKSVVSGPSSFVSPQSSWTVKKDILFRSVYQHANRLLQQYDDSLDKSTIKKWHSYSIYQYRENELLSLGTSKGKVLCKISCVRVQPSPTSKKKTNQSKSYDQPSDRYTTSNFDKYWNRRYMLFQRFDQGISLDDESWYSVTPQAVAEHIAGKIRCDTVLDGLCGSGGVSLKLANTCSRVISNDICQVKLKCLRTNAKVYNVEENIQIINEDFLQLQGIQPDIIFLAPPFGTEQNLQSNSIDPYLLKPSLDKIFGKAIKMSRNIVMLMPPNINVHKLGQIVALQYIKSQIPAASCSIKIEKIFFLSQLKYLAIYFGSVIQNQVSLNDQLLYIYNYLKEGEKKTFTHKKVVRYLRQKYGMIYLFNLMYELDKVQQAGSLIQKFYQIIRDRNLINQQKLHKLIKEQNAEMESYSRKKIPLVSEDKQQVEQQKYVVQQKQATLSYYSQNSGNKGRDSKIQQHLQQRMSIQSSVGKFSQSVVLQQIPRANTLQFCPFRSSLQDENQVKPSLESYR